MPKSTIATIAAKKPRETGGSDAFRAFDFQVNVSIAKILNLHQEGKQYVAIMDHHDDLVTLVGDEDALELSFFQIKSTTELTWTPSRLAKRGSKGDLPRSIVGKAYFNVAQFGSDIRRAAIISNRPLNATLATADNAALHDGELTFADLCTKDHGALVTSLEQDFPGVFDPAHTTLLMFERVPFDLESHRTTVLGIVVSFLESLHPQFVACANPFYEALLSAIGECTGNKTKSATVSELRKRLSVDRNDVSAMIARVHGRVRNVVEWWPGVNAELAAIGKGALAIERVKVRCLAYWSARRTGERIAMELSKSIKTAMGLTDLRGMDTVLDAALALKSQGLVEPSSELYDLQSATIVELMESVT